MRDLGSCVPPISGEHIISDSVCQVLMGDGEFSISGLPWLENGEVKIIPPPQAKCLCTKHNSMLSPLDGAAHYLFSSLRSFLEKDEGSRHAIVSGHDIERWLLKTAKAAAASKNLPRGRERLSGAFSRDGVLLDMLDDPRHWPDGAGLYCAMMTGEVTENIPRFQFQPLTNDRDDIEALGINILGFRFLLLLDAPDLVRHPFLQGARYRPGRILISYPTSTSWLTLSWEDDTVHEPLTVQWVQQRSKGGRHWTRCRSTPGTRSISMMIPRRVTRFSQFLLLPTSEWPLRLADLTEDRLRLDRLAATASADLLPLRRATFLARQEARPPPSFADAAVLADAAPIAPGTSIAIEAAMDAGSSGSRRSNMTTIGTFKANGNEFTGEIATLTIRAKDVRISPARKTSEAGPSHRVYAGRAEIGAAWTKRFKEGNAYLSVLLDDPSMMAPFYASLVSGDEGGDHSLIWSRVARNKAD